jgi:hypothetical protein
MMGKERQPWREGKANPAMELSLRHITKADAHAQPLAVMMELDTGPFHLRQRAARYVVENRNEAANDNVKPVLGQNCWRFQN